MVTNIFLPRIKGNYDKNSYLENAVRWINPCLWDFSFLSIAAITKRANPDALQLRAHSTHLRDIVAARQLQALVGLAGPQIYFNGRCGSRELWIIAKTSTFCCSGAIK
jgi:hypothetical protein